MGKTFSMCAGQGAEADDFDREKRPKSRRRSGRSNNSDNQSTTAAKSDANRNHQNVVVTQPGASRGSEQVDNNPKVLSTPAQVKPQPAKPPQQQPTTTNGPPTAGQVTAVSRTHQKSGYPGQPSGGEVSRERKEKTEVKIVQGNLLECKAEALVSPSNCELQPGGGVSKAIWEAAGETLTKECENYISKRGPLKTTHAMHTGAGNLKAPVRYIIHVAGPRYSDYDFHSSLSDDMVRTFTNCLQLANKLKVSSVAFPAIGAGTNQVPIEVVVRSAREALATFDESLKTSNVVRSIQTVYFVNMDDIATQHFDECFHANSTTSVKAKVVQSDSEVVSRKSQSGPSGAVLTEKLSVDDYLWRYIEQYCKADLDKICNNYAKYTYYFGKHELQITSVNGKCIRNVFNQLVDTVQSLRDSIQCLSNIVPPRVDLDAFKNVAKSVAEKEKSIFYVGPGSDHYYVIGPKKRINRVVQEIMQMIGHDQHATVRQLAKTKPEDILKITTPGGIEVMILRHDLLWERVDAIVNPANVTLSHGGGAAKAIADAAGKQLKSECQNHIKIHGKLKLSQVMHTTAGDLCPNIQFVIHACGPPADEFTDQTKLFNTVRDTFYNCLHYANYTLKITSISIPAISSGIFGVPKDMVAEAAYVAVMKFDKEIRANKVQPLSLTKVRFVNIDEETTAVFQSKFQTAAATGSRSTSRDDTSEVQRNTSKQTQRRAMATSSSRSSKAADDTNTRQQSAVPIAESSASESQTKRRDRRTSSLPPASRRKTKLAQPEDCVICMCPITTPKKLSCGHTFCEDCIKQSFVKCAPKCPCCGKLFGVMKGNQPPGERVVKKRPLQLAGYEGCGALVIEYDIPDGTQNENHPNPGQPYYGTRRSAFLPDDAEGQKVCKLLLKAFDAGLIFTVGRSNTTGNDNMVIWNDIHHKTSPTGPYGYPDSNYLSRVKDELAAKGVTD